MAQIVLARGRGAGGLLVDLADGDPVAIASVAGIVVVTAIVGWLAVGFMKRKGQRLADGIGQCKYDFSPDGLFGKRVFVISGMKDDVNFTLTAKKIRKGDYRTYLEVAKPTEVTWEYIDSALEDSREGVSAARSIDQTSDTVTLEYCGVGGDPTFIREFLGEVAAALQAHAHDCRLIPAGKWAFGLLQAELCDPHRAAIGVRVSSGKITHRRRVIAVVLPPPHQTTQ